MNVTVTRQSAIGTAAPAAAAAATAAPAAAAAATAAPAAAATAAPAATATPAVVPAATATPAVVSWADKKGAGHAAYSPIGGALAPRGARLAGASADTLTQLRNGQYRPFLADIAGAMTKGERGFVKAMGHANITGKAQVIEFLALVARLWAEAKGKRAVYAATASAFIAAAAATKALD